MRYLLWEGEWGGGQEEEVSRSQFKCEGEGERKVTDEWMEVCSSNNDSYLWEGHVRRGERKREREREREGGREFGKYDGKDEDDGTNLLARKD
jgi:hypothetical protein